VIAWMLLAACGGGDGASTTDATTAPTTPDSADPSPSTSDSADGTPTPTADSATTDTPSTDSGLAGPSGTGSAADTGAAPATDFAVAGPFSVTQQSDTLSVPDCDLDYTVFVPDGAPDAPLMVLGHGFQRSANQVADLASHVATWGVRVATPDYCHASLFDSDPAQNGLDAAQLAASIGGGVAVVHAGHSNGGLSAFFAAANDPDAVGVLGLDPVDTDGEVGDALSSLTVPAWAVFGEPEECNDDAGILPALDGWGADLSAIPGANHCDFEAPTNGLCTTFCGQQTGVTPLVQALLAAFAVHHLGSDPDAVRWLPGGDRYDELVDVGVLVSL